MNPDAEEGRTPQEQASFDEAWSEYAARKSTKRLAAEQEECPHDEHDHGICLSCSKDIFDDLVARADFLRDD